ncbi:type II toxin-antitoxin system VapC family toxin [Tianweitania sp.]|uniref:type II toxin-antitoxin system VapC family toxin n=1 Tax=Tianweitania sp. TaxID=2021634 RepID=UPI00289853AB|nr:type II toxin-antitoxin system VapC family toxin [Tianweitania sp.]
MKLLLDTHVALWAARDQTLLPPDIIELIRDGGNEAFVSVASIWEAAIKNALTRRTAIKISAARLRDVCLGTGFSLLAIESAHAEEVEALPLLHHDPFDRLIIAQARVEKMSLVTKDTMVASYGGDIVSWH